MLNAKCFKVSCELSLVSPHSDMALDGVEFFLNSSCSHHELRKSAFRSTQLVSTAVTKVTKTDANFIKMGVKLIVNFIERRRLHVR